MGYPSAARIRQRLSDLATASANASFCSIHSLANTLAGTPTTYLRIARPGAAKKVLVIGGLHAREWAPPTAVLTCFEDLLAAFHAGRGITYRAFTIDHATITSILDAVIIYVAPMMNPDGYDFSRATNRDWRKNRRPAPPGNPGRNCIGVDLNRNFDIAWDITQFYATGSGVGSSTNPCDPELYIGPSAASENETINVRTLLDEGVQYYLDCHSRGRYLLYPWAIDTDQTEHPTKTFRAVLPGDATTHHRYDGSDNAAYEEYIDPDDLRKFQQIGGRMQFAISQATRTTYALHEGAGLYAASGTSPDYAYSRHLRDATLPKVWAFTIECGSAREGMFRPNNAQFPKIEKEVHAAILTLLKYAVEDPNPAAGIAAPSSSGGGCLSLFAGAVMLAGASLVAGAMHA